MTAALKTFRGLWRVGVYYHAGDISARGPGSFECLVDHAAGGQSEPCHGADWGRYWKPADEVMLVQKPEPQPSSLPTVVPFPSPAFAFPAVAPPPQLPAVMAPAREPGSLAASDIHDDGADGLTNVAMSLDAIRNQLRHTVRREDLAEVLRSIEGRLRRIEEGLDAPGVAANETALDAVTAEAWRRKCEILQVPTIAAAREQIDGMTREMLRMLRKRDRGGAFTPLEASRVAILDQFDQYLDAIDARAAALMTATPPDIMDDRHWPQLGGAA